MLIKIAYLLTCRVLGLAVLVFRSDLAKDAELLVLRHENATLTSPAITVQVRGDGEVLDPTGFGDGADRPGDRGVFDGNGGSPRDLGGSDPWKDAESTRPTQIPNDAVDSGL